MSMCYRKDCVGAGCEGNGPGCPVTEGRLDEEVKTARSCGQCYLCCKVMSMDTGDDPVKVVKLDGELCSHCKPGTDKPCQIYSARPRVCKGFMCGWLAGILGSHWNPVTCGMVFSAAAGATEPIALWQDKDFASKELWKQDPWWSDLLLIAEAYLVQLGKFVVIYPPEYRLESSRYQVVDPIGSSVLEIQHDELVVLLMGMSYFRIGEGDVEKWRADLPAIVADFGKLPKEAGILEVHSARIRGLRVAESLGWRFVGRKIVSVQSRTASKAEDGDEVADSPPR